MSRTRYEQAEAGGYIGKRAFDIVGACMAIVVFAPLVLIGMVGVYMEDGTPVLLWQRRVGFGGRAFWLPKLRTMRVHGLSPEEVGQVSSSSPFVTRVGRVLRASRVDEAPQLLAVLYGSMSLVGPRPVFAEQVAQYDDFAKRRLKVRPGLTGWAQVNGNTQLTWMDRIALDVWYVDHTSMWLDVTIILKTAWVVVAGERASSRALWQAKQYALYRVEVDQVEASKEYDKG